MNICVVGTGYVGLVTGACLADFGMTVVGVDKDAEKIAALKRGEIPIYEPDLAALIARNEAAERLSFATDLGPAIEAATAIFIAVGTPSLPESGAADLRSVREVAESIGRHLNGYKIIVTKSTVPIGTGRMIEETVRAGAGTDAEFAVVSNPEFLREGSAVGDRRRRGCGELEHAGDGVLLLDGEQLVLEAHAGAEVHEGSDSFLEERRRLGRRPASGAERS